MRWLGVVLAIAAVSVGALLLAIERGPDKAGQRKAESSEQQTRQRLLAGLQRTSLLQTTPSIEALAASAARMSRKELADTMQKDADSPLAANPWPGIACRLASQWRQNGKAADGQLAAQILTQLAASPLPPLKMDFHVWENIFADPAIYAFAALDISNGPLSPADRTAILDWFGKSYKRFQEVAASSDKLSNLTPFALRPLMAAALLRDDAAMAETARLVLTKLYSAPYFLADGTWYEGAPSYARQTIGNVAPVIGALEGFYASHPESPEAKESLKTLKARQIAFQAALEKMKFPDGSPLTYGDTHWSKSGPAEAERFTSWQLPDYGLFSLAGGKSAAYLYLPLLARGGRYGGGHQHDDRLGLTLWSAGTDVLADPGYPVARDGNYRYFQMSAWTHNVGVATNPDAKAEPDGWNRSALLAYDDGEVSHGRIKLMAGSSPGPRSEGIIQAERWIALIATDESHSYVIDVLRLRGGSVHESFLRPFDEEDALLDSSAPRQPTGGDLADYLRGKPGYLPQYRKLFRNVEKVDGTQDFHLSWTGVDSGTRINAWLPGIPDSETVFSRFPRLRPTNNLAEKRDDFPGWHLYRRQESPNGAGTVFAAVYEVERKGELPKIKNVTWRLSGSDAALAIELASGRKDDLLIGSPGKKIEIDGAEMEGSFAALFHGPDTPEQSYLYGEGSIARGGYRHLGAKTLRAKIQAIKSSFGSGGSEITAAFSEQVPRGLWGVLAQGDGSGSAFEIRASQTMNGETKLTTSALGEEGDGQTLHRIAFPLEQALVSPFAIRIDQPTFQEGPAAE